jgi:hypothetical protein
MAIDLTKELSIAGCVVAVMVMDYLKIDDLALKGLIMGLVPTILTYAGVKNAFPAVTAAQTGTPPVSQ